MKQIRKRFLGGILMVLCALCFLMAACGSGKKVKFEFETNGGDPIAAVSVEKGTTYQLPTPTRGEAFEFEGWYDNAGFTGDPIVEIVAEEPKTFYAKWEQLYEIKLNADGGTLSTNKVYAKEGANIYAAVKDLIPTKDGWQFGAWVLNGSELSRGAVMTKSNIELTARYKVGYIVEIYEQNLQQTGYDHDEANDYIGYEYITQTAFTPVVERTGFVLSTEPHSDAIVSRVLSGTMSENRFRLYFDREMQNVVFFPNYPDGQSGDPFQTRALTGTEIEFPDAQFTAEGYFLYGWELSSGESRTVYESHYIDSILVNGEEGVTPAKVTIEGESVFTAIWSKGYTDMLQSEDIIYLFHEDDTVCYLERSGKYFKGTYDPDRKTVRFNERNGDILMQGRIKDDGTFIYQQEDRDGLSASYYEVGKEINDNIRIIFDAYDGLEYYNGNLSSGRYTIDEDNNYHVEFTEGELQGETRIFRLLRGTVNGSSKTVFQFRNEAEYAMPVLQRAVVAPQEKSNVITYYINDVMSIDLDGYGNAAMNTGSSTQNYYYTYDGTTLTLLNSSGSVYGVCRLITITNANTSKDVPCYILYNEAMAVTYTAADGSTLVLDGMCEATYVPKTGESFTAYYTAASSVFGGTIITLMRNGQTQKFIVNTQTTGEGEEAVTTYTFEKKPEEYAEYYYANEEGSYYAPFIVLNETETGRASVYGYTAQREYLKVAEGDVEYNKDTLTYSLEIDSEIEFPDVLKTPIDLENIKVIVFGVGTFTSSSRSLPVTYWYSMTKTGAETPEKYDKTYTGDYDANGDGNTVTVQLTLVGGFAILKMEGQDWKVGAYSTSEDGVTTVNIGLTANTSRFYIELNEESESFLFLTGLLGSARERNADGTTNSSVTFEFDGKGHGTLVTAGEGDAEDTRVEGTITVVEDVEDVEGTVYQFTPTDGAQEGFRFIMLTSQNYAYFTRETKGYAGEYTEQGGSSTLVLDGFGFRAKYTVSGSNMIEGIYTVREEDEGSIICVATDEGNYYFDMQADQKFVVRGSEYGSYLFVDNYAYDGYLLRLDGHNHATLTSSEEGAEPITGTYTKDGTIFTITFTMTSASVPVEYVGQIGYLRTSSADYNAFLVEYTDAKNVYVDEENDWTVLKLDGYGNAVRYGMYGSRESGTYILITESLLYYANTAGTDACIYEYDPEKGIVTMKEYEAKGYYTENLDALLFSEYGFMVFNGQTRYYYDVNEDDEVTIYRRAFGEAGANKYGFLTIPVGALTDERTFTDVGEDFGSETYYSANGYYIRFTRAQTDTLADGTYKYPMQLTANDETRYPLTDLSFAPTGSRTFAVTAQVNINGRNYQGTVHRVATGDEDGAETEMYFLYNNFRFDLEVHYQGAGKATYEITQMRRIVTYQSNMYLDIYLMALLQLGMRFPDTVGTISFVTEFKEDGTPGTSEEGMDYITSDFGASSILSEFKLDKAKYTVDQSNVYTVVLPKKETADGEEPDPYEYRANIVLQPNQMYALLGYRIVGYTILGYTRVETLETDGEDDTHYTVTAERILATEMSGVSVGSFYSLTLETGPDEEKQEITYEDSIVFPEKLYVIARTYTEGEERKIQSSTYYEIVFTEEGDGSVEDGNAVKRYTAVAVRELTATVYYTQLDAYAEILEDEGEGGTIVHFFYGSDYYVTQCTYDSASTTYTVTTTSNRQFEIKVTDGSVTITEITEPAD